MKRFSIIFGIIVGLTAIVANIIQFQRSCEPLSMTECVIQWNQWAKSKRDDTKAAAERERIRKEAEEAKLEALRATKAADEVAEKLKAEQARVRAREEYAEQQIREAKEAQRKVDLEEAKHKANIKAVEEAARDAAEKRAQAQLKLELEAAEAKHRSQLARLQEEENERRRLREAQDRARADDERRRQVEAKRNDFLEANRCKTLGNGEYKCCSLGQIPDIRMNPQISIANPNGWISYCRSVDSR